MLEKPFMKRRKGLRKIAFLLLIAFFLMNAVACFHAWKFTHFTTGAKRQTRDETHLSFSEKAQALLLGVSLPRPAKKRLPSLPYETVMIQSNKKIECWLIPSDSAKGTVVVCHGYGGEKSSMLDKAEVFHSLGYRVLLPDFMGSGGSEGNVTTIGYKEAKEVADCMKYLQAKGEQRIILFGTSMGAAAVMKAMA